MSPTPHRHTTIERNLDAARQLRAEHTAAVDRRTLSALNAAVRKTLHAIAQRSARMRPGAISFRRPPPAQPCC